MKNKMGIFVALILTMLFLASATIFAKPGSGKEPGGNEEESMDITPVERPVSFEVLSVEDIKDNKELMNWYEENYKSRGITHKSSGSATYVLVSSGEKPTGGYSVEISSITMVAPGSVYIAEKETAPSPGMTVTEALTYPHLLIRLDEKEVAKVDGILE